MEQPLSHLRGLNRVDMALRNLPLLHPLHCHVAGALAAIGAGYQSLALVLVADERTGRASHDDWLSISHATMKRTPTSLFRPRRLPPAQVRDADGDLQGLVLLRVALALALALLSSGEEKGSDLYHARTWRYQFQSSVCAVQQQQVSPLISSLTACPLLVVSILKLMAEPTVEEENPSLGCRPTCPPNFESSTHVHPS